MKSIGILFLTLFSAGSMTGQHLLELGEFAGTVNTGRWTVQELTYVPDPTAPIGLFVKASKKTPRMLLLQSPETELASLFHTSAPDPIPIVLKVSHLRSTDRASGPNQVAFTALRVEFIGRAGDTLQILYDCVATEVESAANSRIRHETNIRNALRKAFGHFSKETNTNTLKAFSDESYLYRGPRDEDTLYPVLNRNVLPNGAIWSFMDLRAALVDTSFTYALRDLPNYPGELWPGPDLRKDQWPPFIVSEDKIHMHVGNRYTRVHESDYELYVYLVGPPLPSGGSSSMVGISFGGIGVSVPTKGTDGPDRTPCFAINLNYGELEERAGIINENESTMVYVVHERTSKLPVTVSLNDEESATLQPGQYLLTKVAKVLSEVPISFAGDEVEPQHIVLQMTGNLQEAISFSTNKSGQLHISVLDNFEKAELINKLDNEQQVRFRLK